MITVSKNLNIEWKGEDKDILIDQLQKALSPYSSIFHADINITGSIGYSQIKGILNGTGTTRKNLNELKKYTDIFNPKGNFKRSTSGAYQVVHKNRVMERAGLKLSGDTTVTYFQTIVNKFLRAIQDTSQKYNEVWYGDLV